ncbi:hypothetical protein ABZ342_34045 [Amycolatopsis sp. NPDC005961]|uniref:hypothetical protein n=1 Tax=Amycolatopsis sp. NPDC005961 TaxID=3156720 RepID=UPI0033C13C6B
MSKDINTSKSAKSSGRGRGSKDALNLVKSIMLGVGTLYLTTRSVVVTVIGAGVAVILLAIILASR